MNHQRLFFVLFCVIASTVQAQEIKPKSYSFDWAPNPTEFIRKNSEKYFSEKEYNDLLRCDALGFDVDFQTNKVVRVKYSKISSDFNKMTDSTKDLEEPLRSKLEKILLENIDIDRAKTSIITETSNQLFSCLMTIDFTNKEKRAANKSN